MDPSSRSIRIRSLHHTRDTSYLRWQWRIEVDGELLGADDLVVPAVAAGAAARVPWPDKIDTLLSAAAPGESWLFVSAALDADEPWAASGHEIAWTQAAIPTSASPTTFGVPVLVRLDGDSIRLGAARFDGRTGRLDRLGDLEIDGPRLDVWRAPIDNDLVRSDGEPLITAWRAAGLDRMRHRLLAVEPAGTDLLVRTRMAAAGVGFGLLADYRWRAYEDRVWLTLAVIPEGRWPCPLPRLGVALTLSGTEAGAETDAEADAEADIEWFGLGPGEAYRDTGYAARVGRHRMTLDAMQTPYVFPQENGNRRDVRWARLTRADGTGLVVTGDPRFDLTCRPWSTAALESARHTSELVPDGRIHLHLDAGHHGIGSAACGPPLPAVHTLSAIPMVLNVGFAAF